MFASLEPVRSRRRLPLIIFAIIIFALALATTALYNANRNQVLEAESLLRDVRALRVGESNLQDVQSIVARYGGEAGGTASGPCHERPEETHSVAIGNRSLNYLGQHVSALRLFGNPIWDVGAMMNVTAEGRLCWADYYLRIWTANYDVINPEVQVMESDKPLYTVSIGSMKGFNRIHTAVSTKASAQQFEHAFEFRLTCLTRFHGCKDPCEIKPSAWIDVEQDPESEGEPFPSPSYRASCTLPPNFHPRPAKVSSEW